MQIKEAFKSKTIPTELKLFLGCKMLKKAPIEVGESLLPTFDSCYFPTLLLSVATMGNSARRQERRISFGLKMRHVAHKRKDHHLKLFLDEFCGAFDCYEEYLLSLTSPLEIVSPVGITLSTVIKELLLSHMLYHGISIVPIRIVLEHDTKPDYCGYLEEPEEGDYFDDILKQDLAKISNEEIDLYAKRNNLSSNVKDKKRLKPLIALSKRNKQLLLKIHKLLFLGFDPVYDKFPTLDDVIHYSLNKIKEAQSRDNWSFDCNYAHFKVCLHEKEYTQKNEEYKGQMWKFYAHYPRRENESYIKLFIKDGCYCKEIPLFEQLLNEKEGFYASVLKLLYMYRKDTLNKHRPTIAETMGVSEESVEEALLNNTYYSKSKVLDALWKKRINTLRMPEH